ncbi:protein Pat-like isoform X2 [Xenopus laevis]|uniref:Protein Pat-like isoform X2 n=1 Tax=Xenopus laevis TaxID=8355 RepID=A0A8J1L010_XENLA|nr:protein Pat-like isoform X2 [Xenopus laevis]
MESHLSGCDPRLEVKLENEELDCKNHLNLVTCEMGPPFINGFALSEPRTVQIKTETEELHNEHHLNQVESSTVPLTDGGFPVTEPGAMQIKTEKEEAECEDHQDPMESAAVPLTDGGQFMASSQTPERSVASRTLERDVPPEVAPDTGSLLRQSMMLLGEESFPLRPHSNEQRSSLCTFDSASVHCQDCVEHKRLIRELQEQLEFLRGTVSETVKSAVSEAVTAATEALTHSMRDIVRDAVAQAMTNNIKKEAANQSQVPECECPAAPLPPTPKNSDGDEMVTVTPPPASDVSKAEKSWHSSYKSNSFPGTKSSSPSTSGAGNWKIGEQLPDIVLAPLSKKTLTYLARRANNECHRFAQMIFQHHVPFPLYQQWAKHVNIDGSRGKKALPRNLMRDIMLQTEAKFRLTDQDRKKVKDTINALLRMPRGASWISGPDSLN